MGASIVYLCYFEKYPRKKTCVFNIARLLSTSVLIERIKILVASWLVAKLLGGEMIGNRLHLDALDRRSIPDTETLSLNYLPDTVC